MSSMNNQSIPNLFIIGAMKSGTTSLHEYLNEHPDIIMSEVKEPGFFLIALITTLKIMNGIKLYLKM